jgi:hypothetical protein
MRTSALQHQQRTRRGDNVRRMAPRQRRTRLGFDRRRVPPRRRAASLSVV